VRDLCHSQIGRIRVVYDDGAMEIPDVVQNWMYFFFPAEFVVRVEGASP